MGVMRVGAAMDWGTRLTRLWREKGVTSRTAAKAQSKQEKDLGAFFNRGRSTNSARIIHPAVRLCRAS